MINSDDLTRPAIDLTIRILLFLILIAACFYILGPFFSILVWAAILATALHPVYTNLVPKLGGRKGWAAFLIVLVGLLIVIIPAFLFYDSIVDGLVLFREKFEAGTLEIPPPPEKLKETPVLGRVLSPPWEAASNNFNAFAVANKEVIKEYTGSFFNKLINIGGGIFQMIVSIIIAGVLLVNTGAADTGRRVMKKIIGKQGDEYTDMMNQTVLSVVKGVVGVAVIQGFVAGVAFLIAGVPNAGIWALLVFLFALLQLPPILAMLPIIIGMYGYMSLGMAILWTVIFILIGSADNVLKPLLLGKGAPVPMLVIFLGVIGGFIAFSFMGLFVGAILLSIGYKLFEAWLSSEG